MNPARILVVDDEPGMLRSVERVLAPHHRVATARTAQEAFDAAEGLEPDLALLDVRMPQVDGFELASRLRARHAGLDVIFMTGIVHELDAHLIRAIREKAFFFVQKPFDREVLLTLVERCLELRRLAAENREHLRRLETELEEARAFQQSLLPPESARLEGITVEARYRPCTELGGDFFDFGAAGPGRATVLVADVSGHGASAAMLVGIVKAAFHDAHAEGYEPLSVVRRISSGMRTFDAGRFVTAFCGRIDRQEGTLAYVNAGHPPGLLWRTGGAGVDLERTGPMISPAHLDAEWEVRTLPFPRGGHLLLYTDGITETRSDEGFFGEERLLALAAGGLRGGALLDGILEAARRFAAGRPVSDDQTLLAAFVE
ncbi:MAG: SpoIIE family protein phosphatase [Planctomycetes bacterium]|nr:SpoIIE family protein phosphatase [Planctomycetota bacterium]